MFKFHYAPSLTDEQQELLAALCQDALGSRCFRTRNIVDGYLNPASLRFGNMLFDDRNWEETNYDDWVVCYLDLAHGFPLEVSCCAARNFTKIFAKGRKISRHKVEFVGCGPMKFYGENDNQNPAKQEEKYVGSIYPILPLFRCRYKKVHEILTTQFYSVSSTWHDGFCECFNVWMLYHLNYLVWQLYKEWESVQRGILSDKWLSSYVENIDKLKEYWNAYPEFENIKEDENGSVVVPLIIKEFKSIPIHPYYIAVMDEEGRKEVQNKWFFCDEAVQQFIEGPHYSTRIQYNLPEFKRPKDLDEFYLYDFWRQSIISASNHSPSKALSTLRPTIKRKWFDTLEITEANNYRFFLNDNNNMGSKEDAIKRYSLWECNNNVFLEEDWRVFRRLWNMPKSIWGYVSEEEIKMVNLLLSGNFYDSPTTDGCFNLNNKYYKEGQTILPVEHDEILELYDNAREDVREKRLKQKQLLLANSVVWDEQLVDDVNDYFEKQYKEKYHSKPTIFNYINVPINNNLYECMFDAKIPGTTPTKILQIPAGLETDLLDYVEYVSESETLKLNWTDELKKILEDKFYNKPMKK